ncbi:MAG TPA: hypothetical protein VLD39_14595, partial [Gammaproteobacteria bacterium]|nr:hypothetical protein [Gammaproteobacteria bacterium]
MLGQLAASDSGQLLIDALEELRAQALAFGSAFDFFFSDAPSKLIAAFAAVRGAVQSVRDEFAGNAAFLAEFEDRFGASLKSVEDVIPSTRTVLKLVQQALGFELPRLDDTLEDVQAKLNDTLKQALVDASAAADTIADLDDMTIGELVGLASELLDDMGEQLKAEVDDLQAQIAALIDEAGDTIDDLPGNDADRQLVQDLIDALDEIEAFLTDGNLDNSLAQVVAKLADLAQSGEDIFDLIAELPSIAAMIDEIGSRVATLAGGLVSDFQSYVGANLATFGATLVTDATDAANAV